MENYFREYVIAKYDFPEQSGCLLAILKRSQWLDFYILRKSDINGSNDLMVSKDQDELLAQYNEYLNKYYRIV